METRKWKPENDLELVSGYGFVTKRVIKSIKGWKVVHKLFLHKIRLK